PRSPDSLQEVFSLDLRMLSAAMQPCIVAEHQESQIQPEPSFLMPFAAPCCSSVVLGVKVRSRGR
ncbi:unnamed protein product, partial [Musa acuminata subsp. burmannicoides]